ncbi:MAG: hypothetical protein ACJAVI_005670 [Candidatus Azotimanducaceae bacterium]|jgi:hypothetical protein
MIIQETESISWIAPIVRKWEEIHIGIATRFANSDGAFRHGEQTQVSILVGAVTKAGGLAYAEFQVPKISKEPGGENAPARQTESLGRADLGFFYDHRFFVAEAKYQAPNLSASQKHIPDALNSVAEAISDTERVLRGFGFEKEEPPFRARGLAVTFLAPHVQRNQKETAQEELSCYEEKLLAAIKNEVSMDLVASVNIKPGWLSKNQHHYNRLYMLIKEIEIAK